MLGHLRLLIALEPYWGGHELADGVEDRFELEVVFAFEGVELPGEVGVCCEHPAEVDEGTHDLNIDLYGAGAVEDAGEHGDALFGEGVGVCATEAAPT